MKRARPLGSMGLVAALLGGLLLLPAAAQADRGDRHDRRQHHVERRHAPHGLYVHPGVRRHLHRHRAQGPRARAWRHGVRAHRHAFCDHGRHGRRACFRGPHGVWCR